MKIKVIVTLKNGVLDPQGKAIQQTLNGMNFQMLVKSDKENTLILKLKKMMKIKQNLKLKKCVRNF